VTTFPFQDFINLQRVIGHVEINLVPLQFNTFTTASRIEIVEAAAVRPQ